MCLPSVVGRSTIVYLSLELASFLTAAFVAFVVLLPRPSGALPIGLSFTTALLLLLARGFFRVACAALGLDSCCGIAVGLRLESLQLALDLLKLRLHLPVIRIVRLRCTAYAAVADG